MSVVTCVGTCCCYACVDPFCIISASNTKRLRDLESQLSALEKHSQGQTKLIDELRVDVTVAKQRLMQAEKDAAKVSACV